MHLLRCLFFIEAYFQFDLHAVHVSGVHNTLADDLSRNNLASFLHKAPHMDRQPTAVPEHLPALLLDTRGTWTSAEWTRRFADTVILA